MQDVNVKDEKTHRLEARQRVAAYFRSLGGEAERIDAAVDEVLASVTETQPDLPPHALSVAAMNEARKRVRGWMVAMVSRGDLPEPTTMTTGLIIWRLRQALHVHPEAFLRRHDLPEGFVKMLRQASPSMLPESLPGQMDPQRLEWRTVQLPSGVARRVQQLGNVTHDLVYNVVGGR